VTDGGVGRKGAGTLSRTVPGAHAAPTGTRAAVLAAVATICLGGAAFYWTFSWMVTRWEAANGYYSHGWLVPLISGWLVYRRRDAIALCDWRPSRWGVPVLVISLLVHVLGTAWQVGFFSGFALLGVLAGLVLTLMGPDVLGQVMFPLAFLTFMVPLPEAMVELVSFRMKLLVARASSFSVEMLGLAAVRDGSYVHIPSGTILVDDVCSGLKYLISLLAFGALYAHLAALRTWSKFALFLLAAPVSFAANIVRVTLMILAGHAWGIQAADQWYIHGALGFLLFITAFSMLWAAEWALREIVPGAARPEGKGPEDSAGPHGSDGDVPAQERRSALTLSGPLPKVAFGALALAALASVYLIWPRGTPPAPATLKQIPLRLNSWQGREITLDDRVYELLGTRDVLSRLYENDDGAVIQFVVVMARSSRRRTHAPEQCFAGEGFTIESASVRSVALPVGGQVRHLDVRELILTNDPGQRLAWYFFKGGPRLSTSYWRHQAGVAMRKLTDPDAADVLIRVDVPLGDSPAADGRQRLADFLAAAMPAIMQLP